MDPGPGNLISRKAFLKTAAAGVASAGCGVILAGCGSAPPWKLSVEPSRSRGDEPFVVRLKDLRAGQRVVLSASLGGGWSSITVFEADGRGEVDTSRQAPVKGSYAAKDPMGLVWSASGPGVYAPPTRPSRVKIEARVEDERATEEARRYAMGRGVVSEDVREGGWPAVCSHPKGPSGPRPGCSCSGDRRAASRPTCSTRLPCTPRAATQHWPWRTSRAT